MDYMRPEFIVGQCPAIVRAVPKIKLYMTFLSNLDSESSGSFINNE